MVAAARVKVSPQDERSAHVFDFAENSTYQSSEVKTFLSLNRSARFMSGSPEGSDCLLQLAAYTAALALAAWW